MAKLIWGIDPLAVSRLGRTAKKPPFTKKELARIIGGAVTKASLHAAEEMLRQGGG